MSERRKHDVEQARREMAASEPIAPISDHFSPSSVQYQGAVGCISISSFMRSWRAVRRRRRADLEAPAIAPTRRTTPKRRR